MPKYAVLITCQEYVEIDAKDARDAEWTAYQAYRTGEMKIDPHLAFICEECDILEEENESND
jgi:hypothetical protein